MVTAITNTISSVTWSGVKTVASVGWEMTTGAYHTVSDITSEVWKDHGQQPWEKWGVAAVEAKGSVVLNVISCARMVGKLWVDYYPQAESIAFYTSAAGGIGAIGIPTGLYEIYSQVNDVHEVAMGVLFKGEPMTTEAGLPVLNIINEVGNILGGFRDATYSLIQTGAFAKMGLTSATILTLGHIAAIFSGISMGIYATITLTFGAIQISECNAKLQTITEKGAGAFAELSEKATSKGAKIYEKIFSVFTDEHKDLMATISQKASSDKVQEAFEATKNWITIKRLTTIIEMVAVTVAVIGFLVLTFAPTPAAPVALSCFLAAGIVAVGIRLYQHFAGREFQAALQAAASEDTSYEEKTTGVEEWIKEMEETEGAVESTPSVSFFNRLRIASPW